MLFLLFGLRLAYLPELFDHLGQHSGNIVPIESGAGRSTLNGLSVGEGGHASRQTVQGRSVAAGLLVALDCIPVGDHLIGIVGLHVAEYMGVTPHQLADKGLEYLAVSELLGLYRYSGLERHME